MQTRRKKVTSTIMQMLMKNRLEKSLVFVGIMEHPNRKTILKNMAMEVKKCLKKE